MAFIFTVLGVVLVIEGIPYFAFPRKVRQWALALEEVNDRNLRFVGLLSMGVGLLVLFLVKTFLF